MKSVKTGSEGRDSENETSKAAPAEFECACNTCPSQAACMAAQEAGRAPVIEGAPIISSEKPDFSNVNIEPLFEDFVDFETFQKSDFRAVKVLACEVVPKSKKLLKFTLDDGTGKERTILSGIHAFYEPEQLIGKTCIAIVNLPPRPMMGIESCGMLISAVHKEGEEEKLHLLQVDPHIPAGAKLYWYYVNEYVLLSGTGSVAVVIMGDTDGTGAIDSTDYILVKRHILKIASLSGAFNKAADIDGNGLIDSTDYIAIKRHILGISKIK